MITEDYCTPEVSKLLREKGLDKEHFRHYVQVRNGDGTIEAVSVCTHQIAMKWLREEHNIIIVIEPYSYNHMEDKTSSYEFSIWCGDNYEHPLTTDYPTYKETVDAALKHSLENLI